MKGSTAAGCQDNLTMMMSARRTVGNFVKDIDDKELEEAKAVSVDNLAVSGLRGMIQYSYYTGVSTAQGLYFCPVCALKSEFSNVY